MNNIKKRKQGSYKIPFFSNGDLMTYENDEYLSGRNYNEETGEIEIYSGRRVNDEEVWEKKNIKSYKNLISCEKRNYGHENDWGLTLEPNWRENTPFEAVLTYMGYSRGRSAADLEFEDDEGHRFQMFMSNFNELLLNGNIINRKTELIKWNFCKKGSNYGLQFLEKVAETNT